MRSRIAVPCVAARVRMPRMLLPSISSPSLTILTDAPKRLARLTNLTAARACRPSLLRMATVLSSMEALIGPGAEQGADEGDVLLALVDDLLGDVLGGVFAR